MILTQHSDPTADEAVVAAAAVAAVAEARSSLMGWIAWVGRGWTSINASEADPRGDRGLAGGSMRSQM